MREEGVVQEKSREGSWRAFSERKYVRNREQKKEGQKRMRKGESKVSLNHERQEPTPSEILIQIKIIILKHPHTYALCFSTYFMSQKQCLHFPFRPEINREG